MEYEGQICRAPMERAAYKLPVAVGCAYNACKFCMLFKHLRYRELPLEQIEAELARVKSLGAAPEKVFLGDGNAFGLPADRLLDILALVRRYLPSCRGVNMDATVTNIREKSDEELRRLKAAGVDILYLGVESGLADVLVFMNKDHTLEQAEEQIARLRAAGLRYAAHIMTGTAGKGRGGENARATAEFFNRNAPVSVTNFSLFLHKEAPLYRDIEAGRFAPASELENLIEERLLLELLEAGPLDYDGFHDCIEFRVRGRLPEDKPRMLAELDAAIARYQDEPPRVALVVGLPWDEGATCPTCIFSRRANL